MNVIVADNASDVVAHLQQIVHELGHNAVGYTDGKAFTEALSQDIFDLAIVDWHIRGTDGLSILAQMRKTVSKRPSIIIMANRSAKREIIDALNAGADDYITKPEERSVIAARVNAFLRGNANVGAFDTEATFGIYHMNRLEQSVMINDKTVFLTAKEFELAEMFFKNADRTLSRHYIMQNIWRTTTTLATRTLDMHISRVRAKLDLQPKNGFRIFTVFGYGYRLETLA